MCFSCVKQVDKEAEYGKQYHLLVQALFHRLIEPGAKNSHKKPPNNLIISRSLTVGLELWLSEQHSCSSLSSLPFPPGTVISPSPRGVSTASLHAPFNSNTKLILFGQRLDGTWRAVSGLFGVVNFIWWYLHLIFIIFCHHPHDSEGHRVCKAESKGAGLGLEPGSGSSLIPAQIFKDRSHRCSVLGDTTRLLWVLESHL